MASQQEMNGELNNSGSINQANLSGESNMPMQADMEQS